MGGDMCVLPPQVRSKDLLAMHSAVDALEDLTCRSVLFDSCTPESRQSGLAKESATHTLQQPRSNHLV